jgi:hypothetical protein
VTGERRGGRASGGTGQRRHGASQGGSASALGAAELALEVRGGILHRGLGGRDGRSLRMSG